MYRHADLVGHHDPESVVVLSGAGVSADAPSSLPTGAELTKRVFEAFFDPLTLPTALAHHAAVGWWSAELCPLDRKREPRLPRLETVLGVASQVHGDRAVADVLGDVIDAKPNSLHRFFAEHLSRGGRHITANFDGCIERAVSELGLRSHDSGQILHFHGSLAHDPSGRSLGATLEKVSVGFDDDQAASFLSMLPDSGMLTVLGYSGSDFFDVDTAVAMLPPGALAGTRVIWVWHGNHACWHEVDPTGEGAPQLVRHLLRAGATVEIICGPTADFARAVAHRWGFGDMGDRPRRELRAVAVIPAEQDKRLEATLRLYRELGLPCEVAKLIESRALGSTDRAAVWFAQSEVLWEQGQWNVLRRMWQGPEVPASIGKAARDERIGACLWVQGRFLPAYLWLTVRRRRCEDPGDQQMLAETEGRVIEHMARVPGLRLIARRLASGLVRLLGETDQTAGVHPYRRRGDLVSSLRSVTGEARDQAHAQISSTWFAEAGNILAALNYRHRQYRDTYPGTEISDDDLASRYRELQSSYESIGSPSGKWRTHLLPGAERVFGTGEIASGLFALQYGPCQRIRLLAHFAALRIRRRR